MGRTRAIDGLYEQIQRRLVESGDWDRIQRLLAQKLNESGWTDDLRHQSKEKARASPPPTAHNLLEQLSPQARTTMPLAVRQEVMAIIRQHIEQQFEE
ncbi:hypothetical protein PLICRDRAFT_57244 [Plicaturopsis crispa FD-325 SS-3]|uniref:Transcription and mRNA export factor SUS1 n=1 Tax=Plicaturopsis crispa FD-325 SS-3 TaxID=944288 RepID=A0A0C9SL19_PLICR|nr:hypothetical protein PLICRDRAFT_57244 [Plicaturopsis crispa FD-325 SS-3]